MNRFRVFGLTVFLVAILTSVNAQDTVVLAVEPKDTSWKFDGLTTVNVSQVSLKNWNGGGQSALSVTTLGSLHLLHTGERTRWENTMNLAYGIQQQDKQRSRKTDDKIEFLSSYGQKAFGNWYYSAAAQFRTQFSPGYNYPNDSVKISDFLAPGYVQLSIGLENKVNSCFTISLSPATAKYTIVQDDGLSAAGAFGVDPGRRLRQEYGGSARVLLNCLLMENINFTGQLDLFSNYSENPQNVDVNLQTLISLKVNKFITTSISANLIYDDDIRIKEDLNGDGLFETNGPRAQFKEVFNLGIQYAF